jgi:OOP family OmpA-OmpF porin
MRWDDRRSLIRATYGEAIIIALLLCVLTVLGVASTASAQTPQPLPVTNVTAKRIAFMQGQRSSLKGLIISRDGDDMWVRDGNGANNLVTLTADTKISSPSGLFGMDKKRRDVSHLLPGLIVDVKGTGGDRGNLLASRISFKSSALRVAEQIAAGEVRLDARIDATQDSLNSLKASTQATFDTVKSRIAEAEQHARDSLAAINARFDNIDSYNLAGTSTVLFATGSDKLTDNAKQQLDAAAAQAQGLNGYMLEVVGYADDRGGQLMNMELSERRAQAVVDYLVNEKGIPLRRVMNPTGMGENHPAASNATASGRAGNRRAEVRILVNKAVTQK